MNIVVVLLTYFRKKWCSQLHARSSSSALFFFWTEEVFSMRLERCPLWLRVLLRYYPPWRKNKSCCSKYKKYVRIGVGHQTHVVRAILLRFWSVSLFVLCGIRITAFNDTWAKGFCIGWCWSLAELKSQVLITSGLGGQFQWSFQSTGIDPTCNEP